MQTDISIPTNTKNQLIKQAIASEVADFIKSDPAQFMHNYTNKLDQEVAAFIASQFSYGNRAQFIPKIASLLELAGNSPHNWIKTGAYKEQIKPTEKKFYRFNSYEDLVLFLNRIKELIAQSGSLEEAVKNHYLKFEQENPIGLQQTICALFSGVLIVAQNPKSACKKINMFLRWMGRDNSPVDLGIWKWIDKKKLLIPLDTHVMKQAIAFNLIPAKAQATSKTAILLTKRLSELFPDDPAKGDFALFMPDGKAHTSHDDDF